MATTPRPPTNEALREPVPNAHETRDGVVEQPARQLPAARPVEAITAPPVVTATPRRAARRFLVPRAIAASAVLLVVAGVVFLMRPKPVPVRRPSSGV